MRGLLLCLALAGCSSGASVNDQQAQGLEAAAIATGAIPDPATAPVAGLYEHVGESATDRLCLIGEGDDYRLGISIHAGLSIACRASGRARRNGERLGIILQGKGDCRFDAAFDGQQVSIPGALPRSCADYCVGQASLAGVTLGKSSADPADALAARDNDGVALCSDR